MNNLIDTHTLLWFLNGDRNLSKVAMETIENINANNYVSIASLWEIAIKISLGKLSLTIPFELISEQMTNNKFKILPITFQDTLLLSKLPFHHRDPFDRIIIAQSLSNNFTVISRDSYFSSYPIKLLW